MTDGIIKGSGNSRFFKTVPNAKALYPTWDAALEAMINGTFPFDLNGINPAGWETIGMKLDKANLLTDALCTALGLATTATPTQAMEKLRTLTATAQSTADGGSKVSFGGYLGTSNDITLNFPFKPMFIVITGGLSSNVGFSIRPDISIWGKSFTNTTGISNGSIAWNEKSVVIGKEYYSDYISSGVNKGPANYYYAVFG